MSRKQRKKKGKSAALIHNYFYFLFIFLAQALADGSFMAEHGQGQELWTKTCTTLNRLPDFAAGLTWTKAQNKFKKLVCEFRSQKIQTGADDEKFTEKQQLLNDVVELQAVKSKTKDEKKIQGLYSM